MLKKKSAKCLISRGLNSKRWPYKYSVISVGYMSLVGGSFVPSGICLEKMAPFMVFYKPNCMYGKQKNLDR